MERETCGLNLETAAYRILSQHHGIGKALVLQLKIKLKGGERKPCGFRNIPFSSLLQGKKITFDFDGKNTGSYEGSRLAAVGAAG